MKSNTAVQKAAGAFCKVYKNADIFKDLIKLLYASGQSQQDVAYNTGMNGKKCNREGKEKI